VDDDARHSVFHAARAARRVPSAKTALLAQIQGQQRGNLANVRSTGSILPLARERERAGFDRAPGL